MAGADAFCTSCGSRVVRATPFKLHAVPMGLAVAAVGGLLLIISLTLTWYAIKVPGGGIVDDATEALAGKQVVSPTVSGFGTSTLLGLLLLVCGAVPVIAAGYAAAGRTLPLAVSRARLLMASGVVALLVVGYLTVNPPKLIAGGNLVNGLAALVGIRPTAQFGMFLGLASALAVIAGGSLIDGGPLAPASGDHRPGRLRNAIAHGRAQHAQLALVSLGAGALALLVGLAGFVADSATVVAVSLGSGVASVATARLARRHAEAEGDAELVLLTRIGQFAGWTVIVVVGVLLVVVLVALGQTAQAINQASGGGI